MSDSENEITTTDAGLADAPVVEKYMVAAGFVNETLQAVIDACVPGKSIFEICQMADKMLEDKIGKVYNKPKTDKGLAFPCCLSVNEICGHYSPMDDTDKKVLEAGDLVKIDLGGHIDGYMAVVAHSLLLPGGEEDPDRSLKIDAMTAAWTAQEASIRLMKNELCNKEVTDLIAKVGKEFDVFPVQGVLSHEMKKGVIAGNKCILGRETLTDKVEKHTVYTNEVWAIDCMMTTADTKPKDSEEKTTIYKRDLDLNHQLKTNKARQFISEVSNRFATVPFCLRNFEDKTAAKLGVKEGLLHGLFDPYPVLRLNKGEYVAQFKCTLLMLGGGAKKVTGLKIQEDIKSEKSVEDQELKNLLMKSMDKKKKKKKPKSPAKE